MQIKISAVFNSQQIYQRELTSLKLSLCDITLIEIDKGVLELLIKYLKMTFRTR